MKRHRDPALAGYGRFDRIEAQIARLIAYVIRDERGETRDLAETVSGGVRLRRVAEPIQGPQHRDASIALVKLTRSPADG